MKRARFFIAFIFLTGFAFPLTADEIYMKDQTVVNGAVLRVTDSSIEYDPDGDIPFLVIERDKVEKIVYDNGSVVNFTGAPATIPKRTEPDTDDENSETSKNFLEFEIGWNGYVGIGLRYDALLFDPVSLNLGFGTGGWGYRLGAALRYRVSGAMGPMISLGAAYNTGFQGLETDLEVVDPSTGAKGNQKVTLDYYPVTSINVSLIKAWKAGSGKLYIEVGYAHLITKDNYKVTSDHELSDMSKQVMQTVQPQGVMLSLGFATPM